MWGFTWERGGSISFSGNYQKSIYGHKTLLWHKCGSKKHFFFMYLLYHKLLILKEGILQNVCKFSKPEDLVANGKGMIYQTPQLLYPGLLWLQNIRTFYFFSLGFKKQKLNFLTQNRAFH